jgi:hypothetical protein
VVYDEVLFGRVRDLAAVDLMEKNVFGARCWVMDGNMAFGVHDDDLLVRLGRDTTEADDLTPFDPIGKGKPLAGWYLVAQDAVAEDAELVDWMGRATAFTQTLPAK